MARAVAESNRSLKELTEALLREEEHLRAGGGEAGHARQKRLGRLTVRERLAGLLDAGASGQPASSGRRNARPPESAPADFLELGLWAAHGMYEAWGQVPAAGVVTGIGTISGRPCMIVANDAT